MFGLSPFGSDIFSLSNRIRRDVERSLNRAFNRWDLLEYDPIGFDPNHTSYRMKILTDDNGHVKVKTVKKDPGHDWETRIEEYDRGYALEQPQRQALQQESPHGQQQQPQRHALQQEPLQGQQQQHQHEHQQHQQQEQNLQGQLGQQSSLTQSHQQDKDLQHHQQQGTTELQTQQHNPSQSLQQHTPAEIIDIEHNIRDIADSIKNEVESSLGQFFHRWDVFDYTPLLFEPENTSYRMKILTDNNGHVNVRTARKDPGKPWETHIEEFYNAKRPISEKEGQKSLQGQGQEQTQSLKQDQQQGLSQGTSQERREDRSAGATGNLQSKPAEQKTTTGTS